MKTNELKALHQLAELHGVEVAYHDIDGILRPASPDSLLAVLQALGAPVNSLADVAEAINAHESAHRQEVLPPVIVAWDGQLPEIELRAGKHVRAREATWTLTLESGEQHAQSMPLPGPVRWPTVLSNGYHRLVARIGRTDYEALVIAAPTRVYAPPEWEHQRLWGVFAPVHALHSERSWGAGDLTDAEALLAWVAEQGGDFVGTLPLLPVFLDEPFDPSPYRPVSRLFWNEFFIDVTRIPELAHSPEAQNLVGSAEFRQELDGLRKTGLADYRRVMRLKRRVLERLAETFFAETGDRLARFETWRRDRPAIDAYAAFRASRTRPDRNQNEARYHLYVQYIAHEQVQTLTRRAQNENVRLYFDLPLGVHPDGFDVRRNPELFASDISVGAPPDAFFTTGQNWAFPPCRPEIMRQQGYRYFIDSLRHQLAIAGLLRIDHVMGLHRLFWIPGGGSAPDGVYIRYPAEELYAILSLESHRRQAILIGENLGIVPDSVNAAMHRHGIMGMNVAHYDLLSDPDGAIERINAHPDTLVGLGTHDMYPFTAFWRDWDLAHRRGLGQIDRREALRIHFERRSQRRHLLDALRSGGWLQGMNPSTRQVLAAILKRIAATPARLMVANLADLGGEHSPQNVPGTSEEYPNWRQKSRLSLEQIVHSDSMARTLRDVDDLRRHPDVRPSASLDTNTGGDSLLTPDDLHWFNEGTHERLHEKLGAHPRTVDRQPGTHFAVWAPDAVAVSVIGDFNHWNRSKHQLHPRDRSGIWEGDVPGVGHGDLYKYHVISRYGNHRADKADPFAVSAETPPCTASRIWKSDYAWNDADWMNNRGARQTRSSPMAIYEVHLGSWRRVPEAGHRSLTYREIAAPLAEHVRRLGFTHVEFLPVMEHPFFGSWGYQTTGYFAPTSRYGSPDDFKFLIDLLHQQGIGVILDWVPSHFPTDEHGLAFFDGTHLYEHEWPEKGFHPDWKSYIFNYGRHEVVSFLLSSALFWLDRYHIDALRVDAVASMLYLDYSRAEGEWIPNPYGGRENLEAIAFLRRLNEAVYRRHPDVQMFAEESTAWPAVSRPTDAGGLGFGFKWDMGWMHDTLTYITKEPVHRRFHQNDLTFRMVYAFTENFVLPLSHDEVTHGKASLLSKMPGDDWQKFANLRLLLGYMYSQPGKKLLFMGGEFGQRDEWNHDSSLQWHLLQYAPHQGLEQWVADLNRLYRECPALHEADCEPAGFEWIDAGDAAASTLCFLRRTTDGRQIVLIVCNFTPVPRSDYRIGVPRGGTWRELLNSDAAHYGGSGLGNLGEVTALPEPAHGRPYSLNLTLPPLSVVFLQPS